MKAIVLNQYGSPDVVELKELDKPAIKETEVLVRVKAASINAGDLFSMRGSPWLARTERRLPQAARLRARLGYGRARGGGRRGSHALPAWR